MAEVTKAHLEAAEELFRQFHPQEHQWNLMQAAKAIAVAEARGAAAAQTEPLERWIPCSERQPPTGATVQFASYNGVSVGRRNDEGKWEDLIDVGADGTPNHDYSDEQVTHWAPLLAGPKQESAG